RVGSFARLGRGVAAFGAVTGPVSAVSFFGGGVARGFRRWARPSPSSKKQRMRSDNISCGPRMTKCVARLSSAKRTKTKSHLLGALKAWALTSKFLFHYLIQSDISQRPTVLK